MNTTNDVWRSMVNRCLNHNDYVVKPRGMEVRELIGSSYVVEMPAYLNLVDRNINKRFMFAEAHWIVSGSNRLSGVKPYMKGYANFSDDGVFLRGAYGPKVVDQLGYVVDTLEKDNDSRQAVLTIWRERPGPSKDIPCTVAMQFFIRNANLHSIVTMRSQDIILGFTYDVFTFSMIAKAVQMLLQERNVFVGLGNLHVNPGSLHLYEQHYKDAEKWIVTSREDNDLTAKVSTLQFVDSYEELLKTLEGLANEQEKGNTK